MQIMEEIMNRLFGLNQHRAIEDYEDDEDQDDDDDTGDE